MKKLLLRMLALSALLGSASAYCCSCAAPSGADSEQVSAALRDASAVFLGRITSSEMESWREAIPLTQIKKTTFEVLKQWKGERAIEFEFRVDVQCCVCGYEFPSTGEFLVYAYGPDADGYYTTSICTRTRLASEAKIEIELLDSLITAADSVVSESEGLAIRASSEQEALPNKALQPTCEAARG